MSEMLGREYRVISKNEVVNNNKILALPSPHNSGDGRLYFSQAMVKKISSKYTLGEPRKFSWLPW